MELVFQTVRTENSTEPFEHRALKRAGFTDTEIQERYE
jgi:hypothetical protein